MSKFLLIRSFVIPPERVVEVVSAIQKDIGTAIGDLSEPNSTSSTGFHLAITGEGEGITVMVYLDREFEREKGIHDGTLRHLYRALAGNYNTQPVALEIPSNGRAHVLTHQAHYVDYQGCFYAENYPAMEDVVFPAAIVHNTSHETSEVTLLSLTDIFDKIPAPTEQDA